jgi:oligo-1,6-glucosidase
LKLRKEHGDVLVHGQFEVDDFDNLNTFTYIKSHGEKRVLVALNFSDVEQPFVIPLKLQDSQLSLLLSNVDKIGENLSSWEARAYTLDAS